MYTLYEKISKLMWVVLIFGAPIAYLVWVASLAMPKNELTDDELEQAQQEMVVDVSADTVASQSRSRDFINPPGDRARVYNVPEIRPPHINADSMLKPLPHVNHDIRTPDFTKHHGSLKPLPYKLVPDHLEMSPEMQEAKRKLKEQWQRMEQLQQQGAAELQEATPSTASSDDKGEAAVAPDSI